MCGICGKVDFSGAVIDACLIERMTEQLSHRGPDDAGVWTTAYNGTSVALGHRRLSIIDLSPRGHQPMACDDGRLCITYNGEIYNFPSLRQELVERRHLFARYPAVLDGLSGEPLCERLFPRGTIGVEFR